MTDVKVKKSTMWIVIIAIILIGLFFVFRNNGSSSGEIILSGQIGSQVGDIAPEFSMIDVEGNQVSLSQFKGKPVVIGYFATWCAPCQIEANRIKQIDDETDGNKFVVYQIGIDGRENIDDLKEFKSGFGNDDWVVGFGLDSAEQYNVRTLDTTLIIDENGNIVYRDNGTPATLEQLRRYLT
jgi:thiol-disulfide isomerase/thioredoxin